jgi:hypothetical protein
LLIAHMVARRIGDDGIDEPDSGWEDLLVGIPGHVEAVLAALIPLIDKLFGEGSYVTSTFANEQRCQQLVAGVLDMLKEGTELRDLADFRRLESRRPRRPNTVSLLIDHGRIPEGARLQYRPGVTETRAIGEGLSADSRRSSATWVNDRRRPILWEADGQRYSLGGLIIEMWSQANWREAWSAVQGPKQWEVPGEGTLAEIADQIWRKILIEGEPTGSTADKNI